MQPGSTLLVIEQLADDDEATLFTRFMDLHMLVIHGGRERTREDFQHLFRSANFSFEEVILTGAGLAIMIAETAG